MAHLPRFLYVKTLTLENTPGMLMNVRINVCLESSVFPFPPVLGNFFPAFENVRRMLGQCWKLMGMKDNGSHQGGGGWPRTVEKWCCPTARHLVHRADNHTRRLLTDGQ